MSVSAHLLPTGPISSRAFFRYVFSDLRSIRVVGYPAGVAIVDACAGGCVLGSERILERPEEHMSPRLRRKLPSIQISAEGREIRHKRATYSTAARAVCKAVAAVMELRMYCERCYVRYVLRTVSTAQQPRELRIRMYVVYSRTCDVYSSSSSSSCDGATHLLSTLLRTVSTAAAAVVLPFYAATLWVIASPYTPSVL